MPSRMIRKYFPGDVAMVRVRREQAMELGVMGSDFDASRVPDGQALTLVRGARPMLCGGICPIWPQRRYLAWYVAGDGLTRAEWGAVVKASRRMLDDHYAPRIEADVRADFQTGQHFLHQLGFAREGVMRRYDGVDDYYRFARPGGGWEGAS